MTAEMVGISVPGSLQRLRAANAWEFRATPVMLTARLVAGVVKVDPTATKMTVGSVLQYKSVHR